MFGSLLSSHSLGRFLGIEVRVIYLLYLFFGFYLLTAVPGGLASAGFTLISLLLIMFCVFLHEIGHSLMALRCGVGVQAIYLHPLGGMARLNDLIPGPRAEVMIALAGPAVSILLATLCFSLGSLLGTLPSVPADVLSTVGTVNLWLGLFNLLPIFPMDGGRVLTAVLVLRYGVERAIPMAVTVARLGTLGLGLFGLIQLMTSGSGISLVMIAVMLYFMGGQELQARQHVESFCSDSGRSGPTFSEVFRPFQGGAPVNSPWSGGRDKGTEDSSVAWRSKSSVPSPSLPDRSEAAPGWLKRRWLAREEAQKQKQAEAEQAFKARVDDVLRKVHREGISRLTPEERELLNEASRRSRQR